MKLRWWWVAITAIALSGCTFSVPKSGVEILSYPQAKVYINDKEAGTTPYKNNTLKPGEIKVKLVAGGKDWTKTVHLENGANTVINRSFDDDNNESGGYLLYFEKTGNLKKAGVMISSTPDRSTVLIDDEVKGFSPLRIEDVGEGDKKLTISYPAHRSINSYIKFVSGYQLVIEADLTEEKAVITPPVTVTPTTADSSQMVTILETETGWLRVRDNPSITAKEVGRVNPKEKHKLLDQNQEWFLIDLGEGKSGWILAKYADKS